ncbi:MAG: membrane protein insertion efficiency factor YidD [Proteobacteria bacterium]|nr:membrane protein insertion efficiency factor YidD [Pseudomonadota bacterium]
MSSPFLALIWIYQKFISVLIPPSCIYWPSCSEYSKQAFKKHGLIGGLYLSTGRLLRCHPFHEGGIDEVPETLHIFTSTKNG